MNLLKGDSKVGRRGLRDIKGGVTPVLFLFFHKQLAEAKRSGRTHELGYDEAKLNEAFLAHLREKQDKNRRGQKKDTGTLKVLAKAMINRDKAKHDAKQGPKRAATPQEEKVRQFLKDEGLDMQEEDLPFELQDAGQDLAGDMFDALDNGETAFELLTVAKEYGPTLAVAAVLIAHELEDSAAVREQGGRILTEKYGDETGSDVSKETCLLGMEEVIEADTERKAVAGQLQELAEAESDPGLRERLLDLASPEDRETKDPSLLTRQFTDSIPEMTLLAGGKFMEPPAPAPAQMSVVHKKDYSKDPNFIDPMAGMIAPKAPTWANEKEKRA